MNSKQLKTPTVASIFSAMYLFFNAIEPSIFLIFHSIMATLQFIFLDFVLDEDEEGGDRRRRPQ